MTIKIDITKDSQIQLSLTPDVTWSVALRALVATILNLANKTADAALAAELTQHKLTKAEQANLKDEIKGDIADEINFAVSNILTTLVPSTPESELTETAIATLENEIIHYAADNGLTLAKAIHLYQEKLKSHPYAAVSSGVNGSRTS